MMLLYKRNAIPGLQVELTLLIKLQRHQLRTKEQVRDALHGGKLSHPPFTKRDREVLARQVPRTSKK